MKLISSFFIGILLCIILQAQNSVLVLKAYWVNSISDSILYVQSKVKQSSPITIRIDVDSENLPDSISAQVQELSESDPYLKTKVIKKPSEELKWTFHSSHVLNFVVNSLIPKNNFFGWLLESGDDITVSYKDSIVSFAGKGSEKLNLGNDIYSAMANVKKPANPVFLNTRSLCDFLEYNAYLNEKWLAAKSVLDFYKEKVSDYFFIQMKVRVIKQLEGERANKFYGLYVRNIRGEIRPGLSKTDLGKIYDTCFFAPPAVWMRSQSLFLVGTLEFWGFIRNQILRNLNFPSGFSSTQHITDILKEGKRQYWGLARESFLTSTLAELVIDRMGFTMETENIIERYYSQLTLPASKEYLKIRERQKGQLYVGKKVPFELFALTGEPVNNDRFKGKLVLMNFCPGDCNDCNVNSKRVNNIIGSCDNDSNLIVVNIVTSAALSKYKAKKGIYCAFDSSVLKTFGVYDCADLEVLGTDGRIFANTKMIVNDSALIDLLKHELRKIWANYRDGPYVVTENGIKKAWSFHNNESNVELDLSKKLKVHTDECNEYFFVNQKSSITVEPVSYTMPSKLLAISDIEGNFDALRKLLQSNNVIDNKYNWIFGSGHLVLVGDIMDRGNQVTECLWLIYSLEEKAKKVGGYVHFILGNHEIMNLNGDLRYLDEKYRSNAAKLNLNYSKDIYGENGEFGKWLRSKNIAEKIGDVLFVHGGIGQEVNNLGISLERMNTIVRPYYDRESEAKSSQDKFLSLLYDPKLSPFWHRSYYQVDSVTSGIGPDGIVKSFKTPTKVIDAVLMNYGVNKIVTGHTLYKGTVGNYGKNVSIHYNGKVINIDTRHAEGQSEGLFVENGKYYRVNDKGEKWLLFEEGKQ